VEELRLLKKCKSKLDYLKMACVPFTDHFLGLFIHDILGSEWYNYAFSFIILLLSPFGDGTRTLHMPDKCFTTEVYSRPHNLFLIFIVYVKE
jgi:hypothetical protein